ncbi:MAG: hypothetical protein ACLT1C_07465 [Weissella confusa]
MSQKTKGMTPCEYREHASSSLKISRFCLTFVLQL